MTSDLSPELILYGYERGIFPMADPRDDTVYWFRPKRRGILPLDAFHVPRTLARLMRRSPFEIATDRAFEAVMRACADRESTWISQEIIDAYVALHHRGIAHSVECWQNGALVGGLYGVAMGGAFFGESMFHRVTDASKVALVHLVERLRKGGYVLLDIQYTTAHLEQFGAVELPVATYERRLRAALAVDARWEPAEEEPGRRKTVPQDGTR